MAFGNHLKTVSQNSVLFLFCFFHFLDFAYDKRKKKKRRLMNLFLDRAKLAICWSQKYRIDNGRNTDFVQMLDYLSIFFKMDELDVFQNLWDYKGCLFKSILNFYLGMC